MKSLPAMMKCTSVRDKARDATANRMSDAQGSAEQSAVGAGGRASPAAVTNALRKILASGALRRVPRYPEHRDVLLAILCLDLRRRYPYSEFEMNEHLAAALAVAPRESCPRK